MGQIGQTLTELFSVLSRLMNVLLGGKADMTLSARAGRDDWKLASVIDWVAVLLDHQDTNHCEEAWFAHIERARGTVNAWMLRDEWR